MTYLTYTGIGSRETPRDVLGIMQAIGTYLYSEGWTLRSGGADGADKAFEQGSGNQARKINQPYLDRQEIYLPWQGFNGSYSALHPQRIPFSDQEIAIAQRFVPHWDKCSPAARKLHTRNARQIVGHETVCGPDVQVSKFVVCWTKGGALIGGTAIAIRMAESCEIPIFNFGDRRTTTEQKLQAIQSYQLKIKEALNGQLPRVSRA